MTFVNYVLFTIVLLGTQPGIFFKIYIPTYKKFFNEVYQFYEFFSAVRCWPASAATSSAIQNCRAWPSNSRSQWTSNTEEEEGADRPDTTTASTGNCRGLFCITFTGPFYRMFKTKSNLPLLFKICVSNFLYLNCFETSSYWFSLLLQFKNWNISFYSSKKILQNKFSAL